MAIEKMMIVSIVGKYEMLDETIEAYIDSGCFHPQAAEELVLDQKGFTKITDENPYATRLTRLSEILEASGVSLLDIITKADKIPEEEIDEKMAVLEERLGALQKQKAKLSSEIDGIKNAIDQLGHFKNLDYNLHEVFASEFIRVRFGRLPVESNEKLSFYNSNPYVLFFPCSQESSYLWGMYVAPIDAHDEVDSIFASLFFERLRIPNAVGTPAEAIDELNSQLIEKQKHLDELCEIINEFNDLEMDKYKILFTQLKRSYEAFEIRRFGSRYNDTYMLVGWIPENDVDVFKSHMDKVDAIEYHIEPADSATAFKPPSNLKNRRFFKPYEYYVNMFGIPAYNEIDPTPFVAVVYTLIYGIMFADVGQGLILALAGWIMYKWKKMPLGQILIPCGISGSIFGLFFGSFFGSETVLNPLYNAIGLPSKPIEVTERILEILMISAVIGVILLICAISIGIFVDIRKKDYGRALFGENGICGLILYSSIAALILSMFLPQINPAVPYITVLGFLLPTVLQIFKEPLINKINKNRSHKIDMGEYLLQSVFEYFETVISYFSNTLSFLRIGAFVVIHACLMMVFYKFAEMSGGPVAGIAFIVFGNILVIVLEALLVGVQSLRLIFYEMFSRFFTGDGQPYEPVTLNSNIK